jgi:hypothetical protein
MLRSEHKPVKRSAWILNGPQGYIPANKYRETSWVPDFSPENTFNINNYLNFMWAEDRGRVQFKFQTVQSSELGLAFASYSTWLFGNNWQHPFH